MKQLLILFISVVQVSLLFAQQEKSLILKGNKLYEQKKYNEAQASYLEALLKKQQSTEGNFNLGDALYKQKKFDEAGKQFSKIAEVPGNKKLAAGAFHNLGNSLLQQKKYEESIGAYKKSLLNNPADDQTRYNLAYAQEMLKKQQQNKDKNKQNQDKQDQDKKNKDQQKKGDQQQKDQEKSKKDQEKEQQQMSKEDAQRMLDALNNTEKQTQDKLKNKRMKGQKVRISKDW